MSIDRALVVYKRSVWEQTAERGLEERNHKLLRAHEENRRAVEQVQQVLHDLGIPHEIRHRSDLSRTGRANLVISVGGDGTFLSAASQTQDTPILGVNSSPRYSVGFFCGATRASFRRVLVSVLEERADVTRVPRMRVRLDGDLLHDRVLNDVLVTQDHPAATSRYIIAQGGRREEQRSSGIWVATAAGSTAAIRAAGGKILPITCTDLQYRVREPYLPPGKKRYRLTGGLLNQRQKLTVESRMLRGRLFLDGPRHQAELPMGSQVEFQMRGRPLNVVALDPTRRRHLQ